MVSRVAKSPVELPKGVDVTIEGRVVTIKGQKGQTEWSVHPAIRVELVDNTLTVQMNNDEQQSVALAGTTRALLNNMVQGVSAGFEKKLVLVGVGYRANAQGKKLDLSLGFSHPVVMSMPEGIIVETPSQTEIVIKGVDKQKVGQVAANIRALRPPEPYKGKGIRYDGETIQLKEGKKK
ncbi:MAG TPA: 50S ribosomal protein L6 [Coxiellaceae bacterium]|nr:50S ribosomal protein L6 [Coxiellaceae bacterium]